MNIRDLVSNTGKLAYKDICPALIDKFGVKQTVKWDSVMPHEQQQSFFGGEMLRLIADHPTLANQKEIRPISLMKGELSQLLFFYVQLKDEKLSKTVIERIARKFIGGAAADRYIIWFFGNNNSDTLKVVISGKEGKRVRLKSLTLEAGQWFKTYDYILSEVERKFNTGGLFQQFKEPSGLWKAVWDAFDISIVNKKFYAEIKTIFDTLTKEELPKCKGILGNEQERSQFAIRLIGRIIFCWFLKRKGIIADDVMSSKAVQAQQNYYRDLLELLFFDVFNAPLNERRKDLPDLIKNYPFLNGGLFEPQHHDHKGNWILNISNNWFVKFFGDTLERYNFTVDENSATSSEIAIDPEMLGRIFENLLAEQNPETGESARKATGSYYTPREIVDFMVEESLIAYLKGSTGEKDEAPLYPLSKTIQPLPDEAVEDFVHTCALPDALKPHGKELLDKLNAIKILDPACGSGAFPISMLQKLIALKQQLEPKTCAYDLKLKTIENSIYGVDIQPMATELSRLRCWLSLIVDEDSKDIKPLPNLDFKFVTANSLIDLGYDEFVHRMQSKKNGGLLLISNFIKDLNALKAVRQKYFDPSLHQNEKDKLKKEFNGIKDDLFGMALELIKQKLLDAEFSNKITEWDPFDDSKSAPFFNKGWMFGVEAGFDIVIANPPYIQIQNFSGKSEQKAWETQKYATYVKTGDVYCLFYEKGFNLLQSNGVLTYITSNKWMRANYGKALRKFFLTYGQIAQLIDFGDSPIFENATTYTNILVLHKSNHSHQTKAWDLSKAYEVETALERILEKEGIGEPLFNEISFVIAKGQQTQIKKRIEGAGIPLKNWDIAIYRGILTGKNEAFIISGKKKDELIAKDKRSAEIIKPVLRGRDIKRYKADFADFWIIATFPARQVDINKYGAVKEYLDTFGKQLEQSGEPGCRKKTNNKWFEVQDTIAYHPEFEKEKLVYAEIVYDSAFFFDGHAYYPEATVFIMTGERLKYLTALLNSKLMTYAFKTFYAGGDLRGNTFRYKKVFLEALPVFKPSVIEQQPFEILVDQILTAKQQDPNTDTSALEQQIDEMVYKLYDLTLEEIEIVEGKK
ncbi:MAG: N-6 DNA methylase [Dissulfurispiraceae bacterium]|jgi:type I restriction-modification system DNA methylase subunit